MQWSALGEQIEPEQDAISLIDLDGPFFHSMSETDYSQLKGLLASTKNMLWVTKSIQMKCEDPAYGLVLGLARTARLEEIGDFGTFEVDEFNDSAADALVKVFINFQQQRQVKDWQWKDYEFALHDGAIYVPRLHWNRIRDYLFTPAPDAIPRTLDVGIYGVLETIRWAPKRMQPLKPDEIEVKMSYIGMNFRVRMLRKDHTIFP